MTTAKQALDWFNHANWNEKTKEVHTIRRALRILAALESGELVERSHAFTTRDAARNAGRNSLLELLMRIGDGDAQ